MNLNKFQIFTTCIGAIQVGCTIILGTQGVHPPIYELSGLAILILMTIQGICIYAQTRLPSWQQSDQVSRAVDKAMTDPHNGQE